MIFGILGNFRIDIEKNPSKNKKIQDQHIFSKKSGNIFSRPKKFREKKSMKKSMKNENFKISIFSGFFSEISKFSIFIDFFIDFPRFFCSRKLFFRLFRQCFIYFLMDFFLYRSEIFPRFQKSYLENRAVSLNIRKTKSSLFLY